MDSSKEEAYRRAAFLQTGMHQEQNLFWNRFTAFAAMHAGLLVIATTQTAKAIMTIVYLGIGLSIIWMAIQWRSLNYANKHKIKYYQLTEELGLEERRGKSAWNWLEQRTSSTDLASVVPIVVVIVWLWLGYSQK